MATRINVSGGEEQVSVETLQELQLEHETSPGTSPMPSIAPEPPDKPTQSAGKDTSKTIELNIGLPSVPKLSKLAELPAAIRARARRPTLSKRTSMAAGTVAAVAIVAIGGYQLLGTHNPDQLGAAIGSAGSSSSSTVVKRGVSSPDYQTILPAGKTIQELGGWGRISPPHKNPVYAYIDNVSKVQIDVSEQPLPANFQSGTADKVAQLAQNFNANEKIAAGGTTIYIGTSSNGPQSVIFSKDNLLVLIKSAATISNSQWATYVNSLQ